MLSVFPRGRNIRTDPGFCADGRKDRAVTVQCRQESRHREIFSRGRDSSDRGRHFHANRHNFRPARRHGISTAAAALFARLETSNRIIEKLTCPCICHKQKASDQPGLRIDPTPEPLLAWFRDGLFPWQSAPSLRIAGWIAEAADYACSLVLRDTLCHLLGRPYEPGA